MKQRICFVNPTVLLKRPIAELIDRLGNNHEIGMFIPKKLFRKVDSSLHYSNLAKKAKIYAYSTVTVPFIASEWPVPVTPMFPINLIRIFLKYNIIHMWTYFYLSSFFVFLTKLFFPKKKLILTMDTFPAYSFNAGKIMNIMFKIYTKAFGWLVFGVPDTITLYGRSLLEYAKKLRINLKKVHIIPTGVDVKRFEKAEGDIRKEFGIPKDQAVILYSGLIVPRKGIDVIIKTADKLRNKNIKFLLVGNGPYRKKYEKMAKKYKLQNKIIFTGWRKDIAKFYKSADIFFLPSRGEGLPGVVMEAMAAGLPVVSSRIPCTTDLVEDGENGFLCEIEDVRCYAEKIGRVVEDQKLRDKFRKEGLKKIRGFEWRKIIKNYKQIY